MSIDDQELRDVVVLWDHEAVAPQLRSIVRVCGKLLDERRDVWIPLLTRCEAIVDDFTVAIYTTDFKTAITAAREVVGSKS